MQIAIQGELGSFSHEAALSLAPEATILPCAFSAQVFDLVASGEAAGVIPIENSLAGSVVEHFDLLFRKDVRIEAESLLRIRHNLIGLPGSKIESIRRVSSHPVALAQCRRFFQSHPHMQPVPAYDTAGSVKDLAGTGDRTAAAIASSHAARFYQGEILAAGIEDDPANYTRFFLIRRSDLVRAPENACKVSIAFMVENRPGSLVEALQLFSESRANLSKIESRPVLGRPWEYVFYADYQTAPPAGEHGTPDGILDHLRQKCLAVKELGRYMAAANPWEPA
ncbi:MAG TPA: prephenate dehydratase domain-containing protein [Acidobacteriaceae bacterium]|nr:prephenate dehydratase domain-containing protein [Acidobacteriaceae bacterium]